MEEAAFVVVAAVVFVWGVVSARLERADLSAPIVFTAVGAALAGFGLVHASEAPELLKAAGGGHLGLGAVRRRRPGARPRPAR